MESLPQTSGSEALDRRLVCGLAKIGLALRSQARAGATARGLSPTQGEILTFLLSRSGANLSDVAEALAVTRPTVSDAVDTLVRKGLVDKGRSTLDPRALCLELTPAGEREAQGAAAWPDALLEAVGELSRQEQELWLSGLRRMLTRLHDSGVLQGLRLCSDCTHFQADLQPGSDKPHYCDLSGIPLGDLEQRIDCPNHERAAPSESASPGSPVVVGAVK